MKHFGDLTLVGGRIRGLSSAIYGDEPMAKLDTPTFKRVQVVLAATGAVSCNWGLYDEIRLTTTGAVSLTFSGAIDGQGCVLTVKGGNTVTLPGNVRYNSLINAYTPTAGASAIDKLGFSYDMADIKYDLVSIVKGIV